MVLCIRLRSFVRPSVRLFPTILGNRSVDFSEIWHEGSLMVLLKSDGARFLKKNYLPWMSSKNQYFSMCKAKKKSKKKIFRNFSKFFFSFFFSKKLIFSPPKKNFFFGSKKFNPPKKIVSRD